VQTVGQVLRSRRLGLGLTLTEVAKRAKCSTATVCAYETGYAKRMDLVMLKRVAKVLKIASVELAYRFYWQHRPAEITGAGMGKFLGLVRFEEKLERQINSLTRRLAQER